MPFEKIVNFEIEISVDFLKYFTVDQIKRMAEEALCKEKNFRNIRVRDKSVDIRQISE